MSTNNAAATAQAYTRSEIAVVAGIVAIVALLVLPLPAVLLDLMLVTSMAASLVVLLIALNTTDPLEFSVFPTLLLLLTLFRLALNVSSTRLILGEGEGGKVIEAFGEFAIGGNYAVGIVIFLILIAINFTVITKGAGRVAEVAARFTLDAMPGRQMSIDADLSAGLIDDAEAKRRRNEVSSEADFYGSMDGAAKFVRGDAVAGLIITAINVVGGIFVGVVQRGMPVGAAMSRYTLLTVGDGLVTQIPALIVSTAAGIVVTHSAGNSRVGASLMEQVGAQPRALWMSAAFMAGLAAVPALPAMPFLALAGITAAAARAAQNQQKQRILAAQIMHATPIRTTPVEPPVETPVRDLLQLDTLELEVGYGAIPLVDSKQGGDLLERIRLMRKQAAQDLGFLIPSIRIRDDLRLAANDYVFKLRGSEIGRGEIMPRMLLALDTGGLTRAVDGVPTVDPSFGMQALWIAPAGRVEAESAGYVVVEPTTVVTTHLMECLKTHAAELLSRQDVQEMMDALKQSYPALVEEIVPNKAPLGLLQRVLQRLLRERVPIRDLVTILEAIADVIDQTKDPEIITEHVRRQLGQTIANQYMDETGTIRGIGTGPKLELALMSFFSPKPGKAVSIGPEQLTAALRTLDDLVQHLGADGRAVPVIAPPTLRVGLRRLIEPVMPNVPVLSFAELPQNANLQTMATWDMEEI
jgi:flagellar biosynthesis protein FlhA